jgi:hypothetical protein
MLSKNDQFGLLAAKESVTVLHKFAEVRCTDLRDLLNLMVGN